MRRLFIIRKDLNLKPGKLAAMVGHCCEAYWTNFLKTGVIKDMEYASLPATSEYYRYRNPKIAKLAKEAYERGDKYFVVLEEHPEKKYLLGQKIDKDIWDQYVNGIFTKTICECKNLNQLKKIETMIDELRSEGVVDLKEGVDYGYINDCCLTDLTPENEDGTTTIGIWFRPLPDDISHRLSKKYKLYRD